MNTEVKGVLYISQVSCPSLPISSLKQQSCLLVWATPWRFWFLHSRVGGLFIPQQLAAASPPCDSSLPMCIAGFPAVGLTTWPDWLQDSRSASQEPAEIVCRSPRANAIWGLISSVRHAVLALRSRRYLQAGCSQCWNHMGSHPFYLITWDCTLQ